jgi:HEPN domain-containing protein
VNKAECKHFAEERLKDAKVLLKGRRWSAAYYLAGYAVECGLKACIWTYIERTGVIFQDKKYAERCFTHNLEELVRLADLQEARGRAISDDPLLGRNWLIVRDWTEASRYQSISHARAKKLFEAIAGRRNGVMQWIRTHW